MSLKFERIMKTFALTRAVNHYYWLHTPDPEADGKVRIQNLQVIIERMTRKPIRKGTIPFEGNIVRGIFERHTDYNLVAIREDMSLLEQRFTVVKEMCHALADDKSEYSVQGVETIKQIAKYQTLNFDGKESDAVVSERLAEIMALELTYPIEHRRGDREKLHETKTVTLSQLAEQRGIPAHWVAAAIDLENLVGCEAAWKLIGDKVEFDPLIPLDDK